MVKSGGVAKAQETQSNAGGGAATSRGEWEWPVRDDKPNLAQAAGNPVVGRLPPDIGERLQPLVVTDVVRTARTLDFQGSMIEVALDSGSIVAGDQKQPIHELELELRMPVWLVTGAIREAGNRSRPVRRRDRLKRVE
jgi:inorganic triphosphatase YgiF